MTRQKKPHRTKRTRDKKKARMLRRLGMGMILLFFMSGSVIADSLGSVKYVIEIKDISFEEAKETEKVLKDMFNSVEAEYRPYEIKFNINESGRIGL